MKSSTVDSEMAETPAGDAFPILLTISVISLFFLTNHMWGYLGGESTVFSLDGRADEVATGSLARRFGFPALGALGLIAFIRSKGRWATVNGALGVLILFSVFLAFLSALWTVSPAMTTRRLISFLFFGVAAIGLSNRFTVRQLVIFVFASTAVYLAFGFAAEMFFNSYQFSPRNTWYRFSGTQHPNSQGMNCALLLISSVVLRDQIEKFRWIFIPVYGVAFYFLIMTKSRTAFAAAILGIVAYKMIVLDANRKILIAFGIFVLAGSFVLVSGSDSSELISQGVFLGREDDGQRETLMGRTPLWENCLEYYGDRPLIGHGFNGFWTSERMREIGDAQGGWSVGSSHSIYVDVALELGAIGFLLFTMVLISSVVRSLYLCRAFDDKSYGFLFAFLVFYVSHGFLESVFLSPGFYSFVSLLVFSSLGFRREDRFVKLNGGD